MQWHISWTSLQRDDFQQETAMSDRRRGEGKELKRDQQVRREVLDEIGLEIGRQERTEPSYRNPNRDQSRGDWDRSRRRADQGQSRDEGNTVEEGQRTPSE